MSGLEKIRHAGINWLSFSDVSSRTIRDAPGVAIDYVDKEIRYLEKRAEQEVQGTRFGVSKKTIELQGVWEQARRDATTEEPNWIPLINLFLGQAKARFMAIGERSDLESMGERQLAVGLQTLAASLPINLRK